MMRLSLKVWMWAFATTMTVSCTGAKNTRLANEGEAPDAVDAKSTTSMASPDASADEPISVAGAYLAQSKQTQTSQTQTSKAPPVVSPDSAITAVHAPAAPNAPGPISPVGTTSSIGNGVTGTKATTKQKALVPAFGIVGTESATTGAKALFGAGTAICPHLILSSVQAIVDGLDRGLWPIEFWPGGTVPARTALAEQKTDTRALIPILPPPEFGNIALLVSPTAISADFPKIAEDPADDDGSMAFTLQSFGSDRVQAKLALRAVDDPSLVADWDLNYALTLNSTGYTQVVGSGGALLDAAGMIRGIHYRNDRAIDDSNLDHAGARRQLYLFTPIDGGKNRGDVQAWLQEVMDQYCNETPDDLGLTAYSDLRSVRLSIATSNSNLFQSNRGLSVRVLSNREGIDCTFRAGQGATNLIPDEHARCAADLDLDGLQLMASYSDQSLTLNGRWDCKFMDRHRRVLERSSFPGVTLAFGDSHAEGYRSMECSLLVE